LSVLPTLELEDIPKSIEFTHIDKKLVSGVKTFFINQPTNGITHIWIKANLESLPEELRMFVPMFVDLFS